MAPESGEDLYMYLSVSEHVVSVVLLRDQGVQQPIYYISKTLVDAVTRYLPLKKLVLVLVHAMRKLPHYFQAHTVYVLTEYLLQSLLKRSDFTGRIAKWGTRLGSFDIRYRPRSLVKGQVLVDFIVEFSPRVGKEMVCPVEASNNEAEYEALLATLRVVADLGVKEVEVYLDSWLVVNQVQGNFEAKDPWMMEYLRLVKQTMDRFLNVRVIQVARGRNRHADYLATLASSLTEGIPRLIKVELVVEPSINAGVSVSLVTIVEPCWMDPIINFLPKDRLPDDEKEAEKVH
ncbi:uncharacterized protein LOC142635475 [Castanea sativa]|uniref:uncharacterized protein LOC142635475 n=1 Tax=Castanea sativa TaxID=21020 RepID=UPI003F650184